MNLSSELFVRLGQVSSGTLSSYPFAIKILCWGHEGRSCGRCGQEPGAFGYSWSHCSQDSASPPASLFPPSSPTLPILGVQKDKPQSLSFSRGLGSCLPLCSGHVSLLGERVDGRCCGMSPCLFAFWDILVMTLWVWQCGVCC